MEQMQALLQAIEGTSEGMTLTNPRLEDNPLVYVNEGFCQLTGYSREEITGKNCRFLQGEKTDAATIAKISECVKQEKRGIFEVYNYRKDGTGFWNRLSLHPIYQDGELTHFAGIQHDITPIRTAEEAFSTQLTDLTKMFGIISEELHQTIADAEGDIPDDLRSQLLSRTSLLLTMIENNSTEIMELVQMSKPRRKS